MNRKVDSTSMHNVIYVWMDSLQTLCYLNAFIYILYLLFYFPVTNMYIYDWRVSLMATIRTVHLDGSMGGHSPHVSDETCWEKAFMTFMLDSRTLFFWTFWESVNCKHSFVFCNFALKILVCYWNSYLKICVYWLKVCVSDHYKTHINKEMTFLFDGSRSTIIT